MTAFGHNAKMLAASGDQEEAEEEGLVGPGSEIASLARRPAARQPGKEVSFGRVPDDLAAGKMTPQCNLSCLTDTLDWLSSRQARWHSTIIERA